MSSLRTILFSLLVLAGFSVVRVNSAKTSDYLIDLLTSDNDLPDSSVTALAQTPDGYLWIGTYNGLTRFDGARFVTFDPGNTPALKHARVVGLFTDASGTLWIDTYDGSMTSLRNGVFQREWQGAQVVATYSTSNQIYFATIASGVATRLHNSNGSNEWRTIALDARRSSARFFCQDSAGVIWCLLRDGRTVRITGTNAVQLPNGVGLDGEKVNCLAAGPAGQIWVGTDKKILRWNGKSFEDETPTNGEPNIAISFLFCTASDGLWAFANNSVRHAVNRQWTASTDSWNDLTKATPFYVRAYEERNGNAWFRQYGQGLFCASPDGTFSRICSTNGLPDNRVSCWFQDREGNLWVGLDRGGLVRLRKRQFQTIGESELKNSPVATICEDSQSNVWIGTFGSGLNRWHDGRLERFDLPDAANRDAFFSAFPDANGRLWVSADREDLYIFEKDQLVRRPEAIHGVKAILADREGRVWLGRQSQLTCLSNNIVESFGPANGFERNEVRALAEDKLGAIWIGTGNGVLYKYADGTFTAFSPDGTPEKQAIWSLLPDEEGSIWIGTFRGGLLRFRKGKFTRYTTRDGLPSDIICQILDDGIGNLWFGSHKGIFYLAKAALGAFDRGEIQALPCIAYGLYDGLPTLECSGNYQPTAWRTHEGNLWFATVKGAVTINPRNVQPNLVPPPVVLERFFVDGKSFPVTGIIRIPPGKHEFDFEFTALSFAAPDKVRFRYQLDGVDNAWVESGTKRTAHYGSLRPDRYRFQVIACNNDGVWNEQGAGLTIDQLPFLWQTRWFDALVIAILVSAISVGVRYAATRTLQRKLERLKQLHAVERERERIAKDIHDDLGAGLTQIMLQSSLARRESPDRMQTDLLQISETARDLVRAMDETVWAVNPENDTLDGLITYVGKFVQEFSTAAKLRCRLDLPPEPPAITLSAEVRHHIFLAVKEALNNVVKHSHATEVSLRLELERDALTLVIEDNGVGLASGSSDGVAHARLSSGHGIPNLRHRLEGIGGKCSICSRPAEGTQVNLTIPIRDENRSGRNEF